MEDKGVEQDIQGKCWWKASACKININKLKIKKHKDERRNSSKGFVMSSHRRGQWQPTPVLLPGKSHGWRSLVAAVHGVTKSRTRLSDFTFTFHFHTLEKEMATHSSVLAWRIPGTAGPGGLPSMGSHGVGHDWSDLAAHASDNIDLKHTSNKIYKMSN